MENHVLSRAALQRSGTTSTTPCWRSTQPFTTALRCWRAPSLTTTTTGSMIHRSRSSSEFMKREVHALSCSCSVSLSFCVLLAPPPHLHSVIRSSSSYLDLVCLANESFPPKSPSLETRVWYWSRAKCLSTTSPSFLLLCYYLPLGKRFSLISGLMDLIWSLIW